jgi:hypothetical protein
LMRSVAFQVSYFLPFQIIENLNFDSEILGAMPMSALMTT